MQPILDILAGTQSKTKVLNAIVYIDNKPSKFKEFMTEFMNADMRKSQKYAWLIGSIADSNPKLIEAHIPDLLHKIEIPCHAAVKRNILRAISKNQIPIKYMGELANLCFGWLDDPKETIAVRVFSMIILYEICLLEPELSSELISILKYHIPHCKPGFQSRARQIIQSLNPC